MSHRLTQRGLALPMGLTFLVVLSLVGITGVNTSNQETRSAVSFNSQNEVFQCTESAIEAVSNCVTTNDPYCHLRIATISETSVTDDQGQTSTSRSADQISHFPTLLKTAMATNTPQPVNYKCNGEHSFD